MAQQFPQRDFTTQFISTSYQSVVQIYNTSSIVYFLDGLGYVISGIPTSSIGNLIVTQDQIISRSISSSYSLSSSYSYNSHFSDDALYSVVSQYASQSFTASYILGNEVDGTVISSSYSLTASFALNGGGGSSTSSVSSSYSITSSFSLSSSWAPSVHVEKGLISGSNFSGTPQYFTVNYSQSFLNTSYIVSVLGEDARMWTFNNRTTNSFVISSNSNQSLIGMVSYRVESI